MMLLKHTDMATLSLSLLAPGGEDLVTLLTLHLHLAMPGISVTTMTNGVRQPV